ncbi:MAG TPA: metallophosphoesterase, partial [Solirubrobacteraceae bacterium]|nr:metallophosphoesterase [Solirubrobacteraceae bacterium]
TMLNNTQPLVVGQSTATAYLKGTVQEVALYNTALTATQITEHYGAGAKSQDPLLAAVGDIACAPGDTTHACKQLATANLVATQHPSAVALLGDNQYESGLLSEYMGAGAYNETWGRFNPFVHPTPGNHEYASSPTAAGYFEYFGTAAGPPGRGYYSYELGGWHLIALDSSCTDAGCTNRDFDGTTSSAQLTWLQNDLAAHPNQCILAYWHHPRFTSGFVGNSPAVGSLWEALYAAHADIVLNGHAHDYERYAQQDPSQHATSEGIREFVVGTGGESLVSLATVQPNLEAVDNTHFGVLFLTLHPSSYEWSFRGTEGGVLDSGSTHCHAASGGGAAAVRLSPLRATAQGNEAQLPAVTAASQLVPSSSPDDQPLDFAVRPTGRTAADAASIPLDVHCSRGCEVGVTVSVRRGPRIKTVLRFDETATERPDFRIALHLPRKLARLLSDVPLIATFHAVDTAGEQRTLTRTLAPPSR